jgi:hypothetical protein
MALPGRAWLIDTPGIRELGLLASQTSLDLEFPEIALLKQVWKTIHKAKKRMYPEPRSLTFCRSPRDT